MKWMGMEGDKHHQYEDSEPNYCLLGKGYWSPQMTEVCCAQTQPSSSDQDSEAEKLPKGFIPTDELADMGPNHYIWREPSLMEPRRLQLPHSP